MDDEMLKYVFTASICHIFSLNYLPAILSEFFLEKIDAHTLDSYVLFRRSIGMSTKYQRIWQCDQIWTLITERRSIYPVSAASYKEYELRK
jgi:hypothetical protein